jgi:hypothetical protein
MDRPIGSTPVQIDLGQTSAPPSRPPGAGVPPHCRLLGWQGLHLHLTFPTPQRPPAGALRSSAELADDEGAATVGLHDLNLE